MKIEILYPSFGNLFGEPTGYRYLQRCLPEAEFVYTEIYDKPALADQKVDMIYIGGMSEAHQEQAIKALMPYKDRIAQLIDEGTVFLAVSNAMEIFESYIDCDDGRRIECLGIFKEHAEQKINSIRFNGLMLGDFEGHPIMGYKTQFSMTYGDNSGEYLYQVTRGIGINRDSRLEGLRRNNFFGTYTVGPVLMLNPYFTMYIMKILGIEDPHPAFEKQAIEAYNERLKKFRDPNTTYEI